jgi:hypothetical protein
MNARTLFTEKKFAGLMFNPFPLADSDSVLDEFPVIRGWGSVQAYMKRDSPIPKRAKGQSADDYEVMIRKIPKHRDSSDLDPILRYIMYLYDIASPIVSQSKKLSQRKEWAASLADLHRRAGKRRADEVISNDDPFVVAMVIEFLINHFSSEWVSLCTYDQSFEEFQTIIMQKTSDVKDDKDLAAALKIKGDLMAQCDKIAARREELYRKIFTDELTNSAREMTRTRPELRALRYV